MKDDRELKVKTKSDAREDRTMFIREEYEDYAEEISKEFQEMVESRQVQISEQKKLSKILWKQTVSDNEK